MKLLMFFLCIFKVSAETYYSDYTKYIDTDIKIENNNLREVLVIDNSKYYILEKEYGGYYIEGSNPLEYPLIDKTNFVLEKITTMNTPTKEKNRIITTSTNYSYSYMWPIRYIKIDNGILLDIEVFEDDEKIPITLINNGEYLYNYTEITANNLIIDLRTVFSLDNLKIKLIYKDRTNATINIYDDLNDDSFVFKNVVNAKGIYTYQFENFTLNKPKYSSPNISFNPIEHSITTKEVVSTNYHIVDTKYAYYKEEKVYVESSLNKEEDITYRYRTRNVINIDPINITEYGITPLNFIIASTNFTIEDNINYLKNGTYEVLIKMDNIEIIKEAIVNNPQNDVLEQKLIEYDTTISKSEKIIEELNYKINQKDIKLKEVIELDNKKIDALKQVEEIPFKEEETKSINKPLIVIFIVIILILVIERLFKEKYS